MRRIVVDTNVFISGYFQSSKSYTCRVFTCLEEKRYDIVVSEPLLQEYHDVLLRPQIQALSGKHPKEVSQIVNALRQAFDYVEHTVSVRAVSDDPDDDKFIECALAGSAKTIVSKDPHLLNLKQYHGIQILSPQLFIELIERERQREIEKKLATFEELPPTLSDIEDVEAYIDELRGRKE